MKMRKNWKRFWTLNRHHAAGFTLVELIVVIAILAILGGVAVPAYNGYVKKAELASDQQLLAAVNTAFASACLSNGTEVHLIDSASINWGNDNKRTVKGAYVTAANDEYDQAFAGFYAGNENAEFKTSYGIAFDGLLHQFKLLSPGESISVAYGGGYIYLDSEDIQNLNNSAFGEIGIESLMGKVGFAVGIATSGGHDKVNALIVSDDNRNALARFLGFADQNAPGFDDALGVLIEQLAVEMAGGEEHVTDQVLENAYIQIMANSAVLTAATSTSFDMNDFAAKLANGTAKNEINTNLGNDNCQTALAQSAMAYAMYTAYAKHNNIAVSDNLALNDVLTALETDAFKDYMRDTNQCGQDIAGYEAAMNMITSSSNDRDAVAKLLVNGFTDEELVKLLQQATNN